MNIKFDIIVKNGSYKFPNSELIPKKYDTLKTTCNKGNFFQESIWQRENQEFRIMFNVAFILGQICQCYDLQLNSLDCIISLEYIGAC